MIRRPVDRYGNPPCEPVDSEATAHRLSVADFEHVNALRQSISDEYPPALRRPHCAVHILGNSAESLAPAALPHIFLLFVDRFHAALPTRPVRSAVSRWLDRYYAQFKYTPEINTVSQLLARPSGVERSSAPIRHCKTIDTGSGRVVSPACCGALL